MSTSYKPLPDNLTIKESPIHGLGVFATKDIDKDVVLGFTHYNIEIGVGWRGELIRTPLAGFLNHSFNPNVTIEEFEHGTGIDYGYRNFKLVVIKPIVKGEELIIDYTKQPCSISYDKDEPWLQQTEELIFTPVGNIFVIDSKDKPDNISWTELANLLSKIKVINNANN
jgi:hypothetical protein